jgi:hypothetical protein
MDGMDCVTSDTSWPSKLPFSAMSTLSSFLLWRRLSRPQYHIIQESSIHSRRDGLLNPSWADCQFTPVQFETLALSGEFTDFPLIGVRKQTDNSDMMAVHHDRED